MISIPITYFLGNFFPQPQPFLFFRFDGLEVDVVVFDDELLMFDSFVLIFKSLQWPCALYYVGYTQNVSAPQPSAIILCYVHQFFVWLPLGNVNFFAKLF